MSLRRWFSLAALAVALVLVGWNWGASLSSSPSNAPLPVLYHGPNGAVRQALDVAVGAGQVRLVDSLADAGVVVVCDAALSPEEAEAIGRAVHGTLRVGDESKGLVVFLGPHLQPPTLNALLQRPAVITVEPRDDARALVPASPPADPADAVLLDEIAWNSAPQVRERSRVTGIAGLNPLVATVGDDEVVLGAVLPPTLRPPPYQGGGRGGQAYLFTAWLPDGETSPNVQFQQWAYFNYLVYALTVRAAGAQPLGYESYPGAPVPQGLAQWAIVGLVALMFLTTVSIYLWVRAYSRRHPEALADIVGDAARFQRVEAGSRWEEVGFPRVLAGFLFLMAVGLILFLVLVIYQQVVLYGMLLPSAQARGAWSIIVNFFNTFWVLFDWGTSTAFIKFFSEYRVDDPQRGLKFGQLYVWWQAITGTIQLGAVVVLAAFVVPDSPWAFMSYYLIIHALIQFPGFLRVFQYAFGAFQRNDYDQTLNLVIYMGPILIQSVTVWVLTQWGAANPIFGPAMGGVFGLGLGVYLTEIAMFLVGTALYWRLGYGVKVLFLAHFGWDTVRQAIKYGFPITVAGVVFALGYTVQMVLVVTLILNWTEVQGNWDVISPTGLILAFGGLHGLYQALLSAISESHSHRRAALTRYYIAQGFKYGGWFSAFVGSGLLAIGDKFILGALGPGYTLAAQMVGFMALWGAVQYPAWFADRMQEAVGRPDLEAWMLIFEQTLRIALMLALMPFLGIWGLLIAYMIALPAKDVLVWIVNYKLIMPYRIHWWQSILAPLLAGTVNFFVLRTLVELIWQPEQVVSAVLFFVAMVPALPLFSFWSGIFGGWDDQGVRELEIATGMSSLAKPIAYLVYWGTALGARISPLHGRWPIPHRAAVAEAVSLGEERVSLV